jgi:5'(3')-deoxyribonucleotidase
MIIGVDLDGVTAKYHNGLRLFIAENEGITYDEALQLYPKNPETYNLHDWQNFPNRFVDSHSNAVEKGLYTALRMIEGASDTLWQLSDEGHDIRIITSRFVKNRQHHLVITQTSEWLERHDIPFKDLMFVSRKTDVYADVYIDDAPYNLYAFQEAQKDYIIFDTSYNKEVEGLRAYGWNDVYNHVQDFRVKYPELCDHPKRHELY